MDKNGLKNKVLSCVENKRDTILDIGATIYKCPETGFKEHRTSAFVASIFRSLNFECIELKDIPGVKVTVDTGRPGPAVAVLGELDAVTCPEHPDSDKQTGAVHACGHNIQIAAMLGAAMGLLDSGCASRLSGKIHFIAVPAEEYIEIGFRKGLREKGVIRYLGGKPELLHRGIFDDVDICTMIHVYPIGKKLAFSPSANGCLVKKMTFLGRAAHAGAAPHNGINALYAANLALSAINAMRETFREEDCIRVHPIITKGGDTVNVIPSDVQVETFVRGKTIAAILDASKKVDRAAAGVAMAMGAKVRIEDLPGYFPLTQNQDLISIAKKASEGLCREEDIAYVNHVTSSTDLGDLSSVMPVLEIHMGGIEGGLHSAQYRITDPDNAYILGAKILACSVVELLWDDAAQARSVINNYKPVFKTKEEYFGHADRLFSSGLFPLHDYDC